MNRRLLPLPLALLSLAALSHADSSEAVSSGTAFNPKISLILDGNAYRDNRQGKGGDLLDGMAGIDNGVHLGPRESGLQQGFNLGESELVMSAIVDPYFDGLLTLSVSGDGGTSLEESWIQTRQLPDGLKLKVGKFLSGIGYQNSQHAHAWDFGDQNLAYRGALGGESLKDTGVQLTWLAPTDLYILLGAEALQGNDQEKFGARVDADAATGVLKATAGALPDMKAGPRLSTAFAKFAPDLGETQALQIGLSYARAKQFQQIIDPDGTPLSHDGYALDGSQQLYGIDWVYKWDSPAEFGQGDIKVTGEYLRLKKNMTVVATDTLSPLAQDGKVTGTQDGYYLQASYGIAPRWLLAARHDVNGRTNTLEEAGMTIDLKSSRRNSVSLAFLPSEFSRIRLQLDRGSIADDSGKTTALRQVFLQYTYSLGPHGAHSF